MICLSKFSQINYLFVSKLLYFSQERNKFHVLYFNEIFERGHLWFMDVYVLYFWQLFFRRTQASSPIPSAAERTRTLNVTRDDQGFGLTLSGDRPVSVQTVRPGGAAHRAGIREKDVIVKVNGAHVTQSTHTEVVDLIAGKLVLILFFQFSCLR